MKFNSDQPKIIVIGSSSIDLVLNVPHYPAQNDTIMATNVQSFFGGKGANQAVAAARLGASVYFVGAVGMDPFGQQVLRNLKDEGVNVAFVYECEEVATGAAYVTAAENKNTIIVVPAANNELNKNHIKDAEKYFDTADVILLQLEIPIETIEFAVNLAKLNNVKVGLYAAPAKKISKEILDKIDFIVAKSSELETIFGIGTKDEILHQYPNKLFVRDDASSTTYFDGTEMKYHRNEPSEIVYTMGMGDAFVAGFTVAMCHQNSIDDCVKFGNKVSLKASAERGSQKGLPKLADII
ncbi:ribokinase [Frigoriflavimonas asaccharolytica]|uniref:Ribokinase n=1 Tax=Frigoriflavimonas asaccharolytica TaxID=2735899 RepID=A0A8J8K6Q9_9FLAO|nr:ribokinase [Frigoriflavimonas asaccharolytica]NRS91218.1 ribokinase [Frigoriflavimonas asaccharolytica]